MVRAISKADVFHVVSCPTRRTLLELLAERECPVGELVDALQLRQPSVSEQLRVLREAELVEVKSVGRNRFYRLNPQGLRPLVDWVLEFSRFWDVKLDSLAAFLAKQRREEPQ